MSENVFHQLSEQLRVPDIFLPVIQRRTPLRTNVNLRIPRHEADLDDCISESPEYG